MWMIFGIGFTVVILLLTLIYNGIIGYMPDVEELKNPTDKFASVIYTSDGKEMGRFYRNTGNRVYTDFDEISPHVIDALIATEDERFLEHSGIDMRAMGRVFFRTFLMGNKNAGGGSTLTQQLAKQLYSPESDGLLDRAFQKPIEWMIAIKLEKMFSKEEIIKMYLNQFDFLYNAVGIRTAAFVYFGKDPKDLSIEEAATLVGMVKNPSYYNPIRKNERTRERRNTVLTQMHKMGKISKAELDSLCALPLTIKFSRIDHKDGIAPYFREELRRIMTAKKPDKSKYRGWEMQRYAMDSAAWETNPLYGWIEKNPKPDSTKYNIYTDGLKIYTSIDSRMQKYAEDAVHEHMSILQRQFFNEKRNVKYAPYTTNRRELSEEQLMSIIKRSIKQTDRYRNMKKAGLSEAEILNSFEKPVEMTVFSYNGPVDTIMTPRDSLMYTKHFLRTGFMAMDPSNGHIKAYVGGSDFKHFQYDMVSLGLRQVGSTIKPFLYTYALEGGDYTPCSTILNVQPSINEGGKIWRPRGSGGCAGQNVTLKWALTHSSNWISATLMDKLNPETLIDRMRILGITSNIPAKKAISLGACEISLKEMVGAYSAYANNGMRVDPIYVTEIRDADGNIIAEFKPKHTEAISEKAYYRILSMLLDVVNSGTGRRLRGAPYFVHSEIGGKTGTTNNNSDGWFMAFTPSLVAGSWVGGEERYIHFNWSSQGQGAAMALPIYGRFMKKVYADKSLPYSQNEKFEFPEDVNLCGEIYYDDVDGESSEPEEAIEGVFD